MRSDRRTSHADLQPVDLELVEKMKPEEWSYSDLFSPEPSIIPTEWAKEGTGEVTRGRKSGQNARFAESMFSVAEEPIDGMDPDGWFYNEIYFTQASHGNTMPVAARISPFSSQSDPSLSGTDGDCYIVENKQAKGPDIILL